MANSSVKRAGGGSAAAGGALHRACTAQFCCGATVAALLYASWCGERRNRRVQIRGGCCCSALAACTVKCVCQCVLACPVGGRCTARTARCLFACVAVSTTPTAGALGLPGWASRRASVPSLQACSEPATQHRCAADPDARGQSNLFAERPSSESSLFGPTPPDMTGREGKKEERTSSSILPALLLCIFFFPLLLYVFSWQRSLFVSFN